MLQPADRPAKSNGKLLRIHIRKTVVPAWEKTGPLSQGVQARRKALRIRHINGMEVRKKRPRGFKKRPRGFK